MMLSGAKPSFKLWRAKLRRKKTLEGGKSKKIKKISDKILILIFFLGKPFGWPLRAKE